MKPRPQVAGGTAFSRDCKIGTLQRRMRLAEDANFGCSAPHPPQPHAASVIAVLKIHAAKLDIDVTLRLGIGGVVEPEPEPEPPTRHHCSWSAMRDQARIPVGDDWDGDDGLRDA
ncbi:uncharacterized protein PAN0_001c0193 [Moesziomyces antarcticus]|uniref:Uncharacterized protein n=1 Tax=Pseudozyma antarctica TaxID=84753 RepID=A0A5C3FDN1_PSEA2|nr:uncharacterized protein PAN0_001c0193 [Moesziomyces antarcticus]GAK61997.1 hypothetical protein PAN0_001c0193 [Moesziomyces antarcticus]SPO42522.1 uncharacterized protein PSANT_00205 [Moesziomyces antarcticus]